MPLSTNSEFSIRPLDKSPANELIENLSLLRIKEAGVSFRYIAKYRDFPVSDRGAYHCAAP